MAFQSLEAPRLAFHASSRGLKADELEWDAEVGGYKTPQGILTVPEAVATAVARGYKGRLLIPNQEAEEALHFLNLAKTPHATKTHGNLIIIEL